jgi:hypothetical protein
MWKMRNLVATAMMATTAPMTAATAAEYLVGGPVHKNDMEIVANYLVGIEMAPMLPNMVHGADVIHIEADVHTTPDNAHGYPDGAWIGYLTIAYTIEKQNSGLEGVGHAQGDGGEGRAALRRQRQDERSRQLQGDVSLQVPGDKRLFSSHRQGDRCAAVVAAVLGDIHLRVSAKIAAQPELPKSAHDAASALSREGCSEPPAMSRTPVKYR